MPESERYTGAWATPNLIGRETILQQIDAAIRSAAGPSVVALYGPGGIGKTRILRDALTRPSAGAVYPAQRLIDLYDIRYHSSLDLAAAMYDSLGVATGGDFRTFEKARDEQRKVQASGDVRQIAALTREALQAFVADLNRFSQSQRVVIALDTLEPRRLWRQRPASALPGGASVGVAGRVAARLGQCHPPDRRTQSDQASLSSASASTLDPSEASGSRAIHCG